MRENIENIFGSFVIHQNCFLVLNYPSIILSCTCTHTHMPSLYIMLNEKGMSSNFFNLRGKIHSMKFIKVSNCQCYTSRDDYYEFSLQSAWAHFWYALLDMGAFPDGFLVASHWNDSNSLNKDLFSFCLSISL